MAEIVAVTLDLYVKLARPDALLVYLAGGESTWLPRSLVEIVGRGSAANRVQVRLPRWKALEAGLITEPDATQGRLL